MEPRVLWLLAVVLALGFSSSAGEFVGLCEYPSDLSPPHSREGPEGGRVDTQDDGRDTEDTGLGAFCVLVEGDQAPALI